MLPFLFSLALAALSTLSAHGLHLQVSGAMRHVMHGGDLRATLSLDTLSHRDKR
jgi:hypothetical protein